jgi:adenine-specific DNA-methyltransferase
MGNEQQKLELTWIGKGEEPKLEPRILIENPEYSYGDSKTDNILVNGDNLLALKALEQDFGGRIKCIYIDPPYNTGSAWKHYDDNLQHSRWLSLIKPRLSLLRNLLAQDGIIFISIDDDECHYLKVLCDEVFGRQNFTGTFVWEKKKKPAFLSNMGSVTEYILSYAKNKANAPSFLFGETTKGKKYPFNNAGNGINDLLFPRGSVSFNMADQVVKPQGMSEGNIVTELLDELKIKDGKNANDFRLRGEWRYSQAKLEEIVKNREEIVISKIPFRPNHVKDGGEPKKIKNLLSISHFKMATYEDANKESEALFGKDAFSYPKPEQLIYTLIKSVTKPNEIVLDSFLGSGTTAAVAHKMGRRWIGIELGDHAKTHCLPRLKKVVEGSDQGGISKLVDWKGGGGFKFYTLAPSLLNQDRYGNWVISKEYNPTMVASAMAKQEGFRYDPDEHIYWKQGRSSEKDFIYTTTQFLTVEMLDKIHDEMQPDESLLISCKAFHAACDGRYGNISIKKIPHMLLGRCEFGKEDYSLNIVNIPAEEGDNDFEKMEEPKEEKVKPQQVNLFE